MCLLQDTFWVSSGLFSIPLIEGAWIKPKKIWKNTISISNLSVRGWKLGYLCLLPCHLAWWIIGRGGIILSCLKDQNVLRGRSFMSQKTSQCGRTGVPQMWSWCSSYSHLWIQPKASTSSTRNLLQKEMQWRCWAGRKGSPCNWKLIVWKLWIYILTYVWHLDF